jgi:hypothetical protein
MPDPIRLRELASWYRELAERAANPMIWERRLRTAEALDAEAVRLERRNVGSRVDLNDVVQADTK